MMMMMTTLYQNEKGKIKVRRFDQINPSTILEGYRYSVVSGRQI